MSLDSFVGIYEHGQDINDVFSRMVEEVNESFVDAAVDFWSLWPVEKLEQVVIDKDEVGYRIVFQFDDHEIVFQAR